MEQPRRIHPVSDTEHHRWLEVIVDLEEGAYLRGVSVTTLKREAAQGRLRLIRVSERWLGIRRREALALSA
jgi:hypothetical protein